MWQKRFRKKRYFRLQLFRGSRSMAADALRVGVWDFCEIDETDV
jgi:hypothetical protein